MNIHRQFILAFVVASILTGCGKPTLPPSGFAAKAELSKTDMNVGDIITLTLTARHPTGSAVKFPIPGKGKEIVVRGRSVDTTERTEGIQETEEIYQLTSLRTGNWMALSNSVAVCTLADGTEKTQSLPALTLHVQSTLTDDNINSLSDIKPPTKPPLKISPKLWVPLLVALLALLAGLITRLLMKRSKKPVEPAPVIPPHIKARNALAALKEKPWIPEPFFVDLSLILRTYLEERFNLNAPESTTEELAGKLNHDPRLALKEQNTLREFFVQADLVKFARAGAEKDVMRTAFSTVETFVDQTTAEEDLPQESAKNSKMEDR